MVKNNIKSILKRKKIKNFFIYLVGSFLLIFFSLIIFSGGWDNFKLDSTKYWGFLTIENNPLLKSFDKDIIESTHSTEPRVLLSDLKSGGPPKDGIPSIDNPKFVSLSETQYTNDELIIGVYYNGEARAYPYSILNWHEIVNDNYNGTNIVVTYCPLCDTNSVFIGELNGEEKTFGVSGKLFNSCLVMYDRETDSLWSQVWGLGIVGEHTNEKLNRIPATRTTLGLWKEKYPETVVLSQDTGYNRDYSRYPYGSYFTDSNLIFPARNQEQLNYHEKEIISYIWNFDNKTPKNEFSGESYQFIHKEIEELGEKKVEFQGEEITIKWLEDLKTIKIVNSNGEEIPATSAFAFVYPAYFN